MDGPELQQAETEDHATSSQEVWGRLDQVTRARVIELFAHAAYNFVTAQLEVAAVEDSDVYSRRDAEDHGGAH
jgi:hypothetical protein